MLNRKEDLKVIDGIVCCPRCDSSDVQHAYNGLYIGRLVHNAESDQVEATDHELWYTNNYEVWCNSCGWKDTESDVDVV